MSACEKLRLIRYAQNDLNISEFPVIRKVKLLGIYRYRWWIRNTMLILAFEADINWCSCAFVKVVVIESNLLFCELRRPLLDHNPSIQAHNQPLKHFSPTNHKNGFRPLRQRPVSLSLSLLSSIHLTNTFKATSFAASILKKLREMSIFFVQSPPPSQKNSSNLSTCP
jgi:hypothetical protein